MSLPDTFGELSESIFAQLPNVRRVDFVTDSCHPFSIKGLERAQRGTAKPHLIQGRKTKIPRDWKQFMSSDENKQCLISFLLGEWKTDKYAPLLTRRVLNFICGEKCFRLESPDGEKTALKLKSCVHHKRRQILKSFFIACI